MSQEQITAILQELREQRHILMQMRGDISRTIQANVGHDREFMVMNRRIEKIEEAQPEMVTRAELQGLTNQVESLKRAVWGAMALAAVGMPVALSLLNKWLST